MRPHQPLPVLVAVCLCSSLLIGCSGSPDAPDPLPILVGPDFASAGAGPPREGSGTGLITSLEILSSRNAGSNVIQERRLTGIVQGTLEGTFVEHVRGVIHGNGQVTFQGTMEFTGSLDGCGTGTLTLGLTGKGLAGAPVTEATVQPIRRGSNTLAVSGTGTVSQVGPNMTYEIRYLCR